MKKGKIRILVNLISVVLVLFVNYYSQTGQINGITIGKLSDEYSNLFTPAGYAFAIWGIIFMGLIAYVIYDIIQVFVKNKKLDESKNTGYWFALVNLANASWVVAWLYEYTGLSVVIMLIMLFGLIFILIKAEVGLYKVRPSLVIFNWWPICLYAGWITVATIANIAAYLSKINFQGFMSEVQWTLLMLIIAAFVNLFMIWKRNLKVFALVGVWAFLAIYVRHQESQISLALTAIFLASILFVNVLIKYFMVLRGKQ